MAKVASSTLQGVDFFNAVATQEFALGTRASFTYTDSAGIAACAEAVFCAVTSTISEGSLCELKQVRGTDAYNVNNALTKTNSATLANTQYDSFAACVALTSAVSGEFAWFGVKGLLPINVASGAVKGIKLGLTATSGQIDDADTDYEVVGAFLPTQAASSGITDVNCMNDLHIIRNAS